MSLYRYDVTWLIPDRPNDGKPIDYKELAKIFREELISCMAPNALDAVTQTQYQAEMMFLESYGPSVERRPYVKTCWCRGEATATVYHYSPPEGAASAEVSWSRAYCADTSCECHADPAKRVVTPFTDNGWPPYWGAWNNPRPARFWREDHD